MRATGSGMAAAVTTQCQLPLASVSCNRGNPVKARPHSSISASCQADMGSDCSSFCLATRHGKPKLNCHGIVATAQLTEGYDVMHVAAVLRNGLHGKTHFVFHIKGEHLVGAAVGQLDCLAILHCIASPTAQLHWLHSGGHPLLEPAA